MNWEKFHNKFHKSWHRSMKPFIESNDCNKIYTFLKANKDKGTIVPSSMNTFRNFKNANLNKTRMALFFREPYSDIEPDGIPLSCELSDKISLPLNKFYNAMEKEFYGLSLDMIKDKNLDYYLRQDVFFHNVDVTVFKNKPGSHKDLWKNFTKHVIKILVKKNIPIMFIGEDVRDKYIKLIPPMYPEFFIKEDILNKDLVWNTNNKFKDIGKYIWDNTAYNEVMWVNMDVPY